MAAAAAASVRRDNAVFTARLGLKLDCDRPSETLVEVNMLADGHFELNVEESKLLAILYGSTSSATFRALRIIPVMEREEDDYYCIDCIALYPELLEHAEKHLLPFCRAAGNAAVYTKMKVDTYWSMDMLKEEEDKQQAIDIVLAAYEAASQASENVSPAHPLRLPLLLMKRAFYHDIMEWPECAIALGKRALEEPGPELASPSLNAEPYKDSAEVLGFIKKNSKSKDPDNTFKAWFGTVSPPPPVVPHSVPAVAPDIFASPGDWGYDVHERLSLSEMRSRKKAARIAPMG